MQTMEFVTAQIEARDPDQEYVRTDELQMWKEMIGSNEMKGLFMSDSGNWMFDLRYKRDSVARQVYGSRACDLAISGPDAIEVPAEVCEALGLTTQAFQDERYPIQS